MNCVCAARNHKMTSAARSQGAFSCCAGTMPCCVMTAMDTTMLVSIFAVLGILGILIGIQPLIASILISLLPCLPSSVLKEPSASS